jgi:putative RNA 2'-phosphotransferase
MENKKLIKISKFLSLVLRHKPEVIGLKLDQHGWIKVDELIQAMHDSDWNINRKILNNIVEDNDKNRFSLSKDGQKIKANQGHSLDIDLELKPAKPPEILYHGTVSKFLGHIYNDGLLSCNRQYVHLSEDIETAIDVGLRRGKPTILEIKAGAMYKDGFIFYISDNGVWLTDKVPIKYFNYYDNDTEMK